MASAPSTGRTVTLAMTGMTESLNPVRPMTLASPSPARDTSKLWNGPPTARSTQRAPSPLTRALARSRPSALPDSTTWPPPLSLATSTSAPCGCRSAHIRSTSSMVGPMTAIIPASAGTPVSIRRPRSATRRRASSKSRAPAATRALYSPRLCPATNEGRRPDRCSSRHVITLTVKTAGCVTEVRRRSDAPPSEHMRATSQPRMALARSIHRAHRSGARSTRCSAMPGFWLPCPGNTTATGSFSTTLPPCSSFSSLTLF